MVTHQLQLELTSHASHSSPARSDLVHDHTSTTHVPAPASKARRDHPGAGRSVWAPDTATPSSGHVPPGSRRLPAQPQVQTPRTLCSATLNLSSIFLDVGLWLIQVPNSSKQNSLSWRPNPWVLKLESSRLDSLAPGGFL